MDVYIMLSSPPPFFFFLTRTYLSIRFSLHPLQHFEREHPHILSINQNINWEEKLVAFLFVLFLRGKLLFNFLTQQYYAALQKDG